MIKVPETKANIKTTRFPKFPKYILLGESTEKLKVFFNINSLLLLLRSSSLLNKSFIELEKSIFKLLSLLYKLFLFKSSLKIIHHITN